MFLTKNAKEWYIICLIFSTLTSYAIIERAWKQGFPTCERWGIFSGEQVHPREPSNKVSA